MLCDQTTIKTGHLRTSGGSFFIEPSPEADDKTGVVRHVIYRVRHPVRFEQPVESSSPVVDLHSPEFDGHVSDQGRWRLSLLLWKIGVTSSVLNT